MTAVHSPDDALLRLLIDSVTDYAIFSLDPTGQITRWNAAAEKLKGYSAQEILGPHVSRFYTEHDGVAKAAYLLQRAIAQGRVEDEGWRVRKDGSRFWAWVVISPMYDTAGELRGFAKVTRDLSERKQAEENRIRLAHDIRESLADLIELRGYNVVAVVDGREALTRLKAGLQPCLIILDLMLPVMSGWEFRRQQLADPRWSENSYDATVRD